ncbi:3-hydroxyacyl-CoA dehydrogenase / enoyl-CoA hydratase / 3-hydroxybutyryl-CoA epimerase / enoyl-CoA isomerase [Roseateles sp. YR242]|uniref:fatty acid oxidation complex subunit alpha FadB n=1 Tax=Roseateles sp. YR242 TaxID=1855305 RepID=UPI0008BE7B1D|nr:fatty acid oxidation complex subunit alpha FadB [Roseateles sp. YR242]SEL22865.1 3-hydroxyacyl-CoA dehydrogenase / enoyl-CoA hydratase / 3-hydroxybutyryl-CoA epimerase / enoyl-CoA isomerase [Roseateles sp. YR242]
MFEGQNLRLTRLPGEAGLVELCFDRQGDVINKLDERTVAEFRRAVAWLGTEAAALQAPLRGVLVTSAKDGFIVGADITEFSRMFEQPAHAIAEDVFAKNQIFNAFEDLPLPSVVAINGFALGGGLELALAGALRVMSTSAQIGLPEVKLGLFPGFGGTVRLSRVAGPKVAVDWVAGGRNQRADAALAAGVVDELAAPEQLREAALALLRRAAAGDTRWQAAQQAKRASVPPDEGLREWFEQALRSLEKTRQQHQPAAWTAVDMMSRAASQLRDGALRLEAEAFAAITQTQAAHGLVQVFLNEQAVKKRARTQRLVKPVKQLAVLGAGIMGGGIAYTAALRGTPVRLKDIAPQALDAGLAEAAKLLNRQVAQGRLTQDRAAAVLATIGTQADDQGFGEVDLVIEAIVERLDVKQQVLGALENSVREDTVIASNTSSLRLSDIGAHLRHPERFVGMHFFNPVPVMPLVEVIRGARTSEQAVATAVAQVLAMGKTPIVVRDGPGFLVNRIISPYVLAFSRLVAEGGDFIEIDRVMEAFGWPMGPAWLQDVVGMDVGAHVGEVIAAGYPQRMQAVAGDPIRAMVAAGRYGQKNGRGFYRYTRDEAGKPQKSVDPEARALVATLQADGPVALDADTIIERLMLPMIVEAAHALEDGVVATAAELDMALLLGLGFPAHAGGVLKYADWMGLAHVVQRCDRLAGLGPAYEPTPRMRMMAASGARFHESAGGVKAPSPVVLSAGQAARNDPSHVQEIKA